MKKEEREISVNKSSGAEKVEKIQKTVKKEDENGGKSVKKTTRTVSKKTETARGESAMGNPNLNSATKPQKRERVSAKKINTENSGSKAEIESAKAKARVEIALKKKEAQEKKKAERAERLAKKKAEKEKRIAEKKALIEKRKAEKKALIEKRSAQKKALIEKRAKEKEAAELFINFLCDPEIAAANMEWICYSTPLKLETVEAFMDPETLEDPIAYPSDEEKANGQVFASLPASVSRLMESLFLEARIRK